MPVVDIKDFDALVCNKLFFDQPVKKKKRMNSFLKCQEKIIILQKIC